MQTPNEIPEAGHAAYTVEDAAAVKTPTAKEKQKMNEVSEAKTYQIEDAADVATGAHSAAGGDAILQRLSVRPGDNALVRFITSQMVTLQIHFSIPSDDGGQTTLVCNGPSCLLCRAKFNPARQSLLPVLSIDDLSIRVLTIGRTGGPGSLFAQILPLLKKPDISDYVYELSKPQRLYIVKTVAKIEPGATDDRDFGDDILRDLIESGQIPTPEDLVATVQQMDNDVIEATFERVARRLRQFGAAGRK